MSELDLLLWEMLDEDIIAELMRAPLAPAFCRETLPPPKRGLS